MTINIEKAKQAIASLQREKQEQENRLLLAAEAKERLNTTGMQTTESTRSRSASTLPTHRHQPWNNIEMLKVNWD